MGSASRIRWGRIVAGGLLAEVAILIVVTPLRVYRLLVTRHPLLPRAACHAW